MEKRLDSASKLIRASPGSLYQAHVDPTALAAWLPPRGMRARIDGYEPREGGSYRIVLTYEQPDLSAPGKTTEHSDVVRGRFLELVPNERIVQSVEFESDDPAFAGHMRMTWTFTAVTGGTIVTVCAEDVPAGIRPEDHEAGFRSTLDNLAACVEDARGTRSKDVGSPRESR
jgi:uncharacterized protein YndB with AHSA1/START domain